MKGSVLLTIMLTASVLFVGCLAQQGLKSFLGEGEAADANLVNFALPENGAVLSVSDDNPKHPGSTLNNGISSSENWLNGEGWEMHFNGRYEYGRYFGYGHNAEAAMAAAERREWEMRLSGENVNEIEIDPSAFEEEDYKWRGLRGNDYYDGRRIQSAMGWVVIEFPGEKLINRFEIYTLDSKEFPASQYGVNHILLQYWAPQAKGWQNVDRYGKRKGQQFDGIRDIKKGKLSVRFKPVRTEKVRLAVLWTNDSKKHPRERLRRNEIVEGIVRLVELEVYGFEKKEGADVITTGGQEDILSPDEELDLLLNEPPPSDEEKVSPAIEQSDNIEAVVRAYAQAYRGKDITAFMATISPNYNRDGETYQKLEGRMKELFGKYDNITFNLQGLHTSPNENEATVAASYSLKLEKSGDKPSLYSGKLVFSLSNASGGWKIIQVGPKK